MISCILSLFARLAYYHHHVRLAGSHQNFFCAYILYPCARRRVPYMRLRKNWSKNFLKKLLTFCSTFDIIHHVKRTSERRTARRKNLEKSSWHIEQYVIEWVQRNKETRLTTERAFELTVSVGRATCQVIPLCPPTCVCTLHGFKSTVCMHGGHAKVYPPTRTQGKAENTKNFFLTYWVICDRIKLHRTAKAARWTAKAKKIVLDILSNMWYNKDKLKSWTTR